MIAIRQLVCGIAAAIPFCSQTFAGSPAMVELKTAAESFQGRSLAHDKQLCWLLDRTGELHEVRLDRVESFRKLSDRFRPESVVQARDRLACAAPRGMEVIAQGKYVVMGPSGRVAAYARLLDGVYDDFWNHFSRRQFPLEKPEFPLVVLVFPTRQQFAAYAQAEGTAIPPTLKGYYHRISNRIALYSESSLTADVGDASESAVMARGVGSSSGDVLASIDGSLKDTLIHEATHQLAYNTGLHSRVGDHPRWVSEGLAMLFEEESRRDDRGGRDPADRVNRSRYLWFMNYRRERRDAKGLEEFLASNDLFSRAGLDAYSEAWALSFYLIETRRADYARYLQTIAERDPLQAYGEDERRDDFRTAFGKDIEYFEGQYLLYFDRIARKIR